MSWWQKFASQFQLIFSDCAVAFYLLCPSTPMYRNTPAPQLGGSDSQPTSWVREVLVLSALFLLAHGPAKTALWDKFHSLEPGSKQLPESATSTCRLTQLLQAEEVQVILRLLLQD